MELHRFTKTPVNGRILQILLKRQAFICLPQQPNIESATGSDAKIDVSANVVWTASSDQTWLTVSPLNGTGIGQKLTFTADANPLFTERIAKVTVSAPWSRITGNYYHTK